LTAFKEYADGPRTVEYTEAKLNKGLIGGQFKKEASNVFAYFDTITEAQIAEIQAAFAADGYDIGCSRVVSCCHSLTHSLIQPCVAKQPSLPTLATVRNMSSHPRW
jgi:hypothetical protein